MINTWYSEDFAFLPHCFHDLHCCRKWCRRYKQRSCSTADRSCSEAMDRRRLETSENPSPHSGCIRTRHHERFFGVCQGGGS